jgi:transposase
MKLLKSKRDFAFKPCKLFLRSYIAGLNLKENSSGKHKGKTTISKRGRKRLRAILFQGVLPVVATNEEFKELHQYYTTRGQNRL